MHSSCNDSSYFLRRGDKVSIGKVGIIRTHSPSPRRRCGWWNCATTGSTRRTRTVLTVGFVGCGRAGRVLGHLWHRGGVFRIGPVLTRSPASAADAVRRIGAGTPLESPAGLAPADVLVLATPDRFLADAAAGLAGSGAVALHLSGALPSALLREAGLGGPVAGIHPAHSFGDSPTRCAASAEPGAPARATKPPSRC